VGVRSSEAGGWEAEAKRKKIATGYGDGKRNGDLHENWRFSRVFCFTKRLLNDTLREIRPNHEQNHQSQKMG
jgi:hypothetical protein